MTFACLHKRNLWTTINFFSLNEQCPIFFDELSFTAYLPDLLLLLLLRCRLLLLGGCPEVRHGHRVRVRREGVAGAQQGADLDALALQGVEGCFSALHVGDGR